MVIFRFGTEKDAEKRREMRSFLEEVALVIIDVRRTYQLPLFDDFGWPKCADGPRD